MMLSCMLTKVYLKRVTSVLSGDILAKFQRPFMKPFNLTTRRQSINTETSLDLLYALVFYYASSEYDFSFQGD